MKHIIANSFARSYSTEYKQFKGVDFSTDAVSIDKSRSPYAPNMISDAGGMHEKRMGWRELVTFPPEESGTHYISMPINGLFGTTVVMPRGEEFRPIAHVGTKLYEVPLGISAVPIEVMSGLKNHAGSTCVYHGGKLYIFTGNEYICYDGTAYPHVVAHVVGYTPTVTIGRGATGGGTPFEAINLLSNATIDSFCITKAVFETPTKTFFTSFQALDALVGETNRVEMEYLLPGGTWAKIYEGAVDESLVPYFTVDRTAGSITLSDSIHTWFASSWVYIEGVDNLKITVYKTRSGDADKITKATVCTQYNGFVFCAGVDRGRDYHSAFNDPTYFPADGYDDVGTSNTDIVGYNRAGRYLAIIKEDNDQDATVFFRYDTTFDGEVVFMRENAITGVGGIARRGFATLNGEPLFLSREGVHAIVSNDLTDERIVQGRSGFVDPLLTAEDNLEAAHMVVWGKRCLVCVNDKAYVLDASQNKSNKGYECFYWTNIPATCATSNAGDLFFGTVDSKLCKFNTDIETSDKYSDTKNDTLGSPVATAIDASWSTKIDDDGNFAEKKSLMRAGTALLVKPYTISSVEVALTTDRTFKVTVSNLLAGIFDFSELDFAYLDFNTLDTPRVIPIRGNFRRYNTLQITVRNAVVNQGFGVYGIIKQFYKCGVVR